MLSVKVDQNPILSIRNSVDRGPTQNRVLRSLSSFFAVTGGDSRTGGCEFKSCRQIPARQFITFICYKHLLFSNRYSSFWQCCAGAKAFVWPDRMLHHRADPTNAMIGGDNSQTRSPWGVQVKQLTKICWHLICSPIHPGESLWALVTPVKAIRVGGGFKNCRCLKRMKRGIFEESWSRFVFMFSGFFFNRWRQIFTKTKDVS